MLQECKSELASCKAKLISLSIKDMSKLLPMCKTSTSKNEIFILNDMIEKSDFDEEKERDNTKTSLRLLRNDVQRYIKELKGFTNSHEYYQKIESMAKNITNEITEYKTKMSYQFDDLAQQEEALTDELKMLEQKMDNYDVVQKQPVIKRKPMQNNEETISELGLIKQKVDLIDEKIDQIKLLEPEDHREFLRVRTKHKGKVSQNFVNDCLKAIPFITEDQLMEQIENYNLLQQFEDEKKELLTEYKRKKEENKQIQLQQEQQQQEIERQKQVKKPLVPKEERDKLKEDIKQWKIKKVTQKAIDEIEYDTKKDIEKQKSEMLKKEREEKKLQVQYYREQKLIEKQREQELKQVETMSRRYVSQEAIERIKMKENQLLEKKKSILEQKQKKQFDQEIKQQARDEDKYIKFAYVESKFNETTKAAEQQKRQKFDPKIDQGKYADTFGGNLLGAGRRAIPGWRQNLG
ncbi:unnamed protein product (macronuclear) [Paramecium tetraurelia]|uniref:Trichohyalin-plectin-homology domain-containing protein n=1 Tax=Paramecium tetraurelia TaxID=5888 RepID=A0BF87_PARTE|nr:uncharacterized protein GSPATT00028239001 [Paramecium tetraurelia]CAK57204.1 unnamed protein product [Paramecium tetraurelia]|eukprot:XP_001424602.1 hypothetical protein (macronuclear) [Paramecium tetraurelia strain d4-2]